MGVEDPIFHCVDEIQFVKAISVGSIIEFITTVVYSQNNYIVIQVHASKVDHITGNRSKTNILSYIFNGNIPSNDLNANDTNVIVPSVMPREYDEFIHYLEGKRSFDKLINYIN